MSSLLRGQYINVASESCGQFDKGNKGYQDSNELSKSTGMIPAGSASLMQYRMCVSEFACLVSRPTKQTVKVLYHPSKTLSKHLLM